MKKESIFAILRAEGQFIDIEKWAITTIFQGKAAEYVCKLEKDHISYFVKDITPNEKNTLHMILPLNFKHFIKTPFANLLEKGVLVADFVEGGNYKGTRLSSSLLTDYASMQITLNNKDYYDMHYKGDKNIYLTADDGYFRKSAYERIKLSIRILGYLYKKNDKLMNKYYILFNEIERVLDSIVYYYYSMPFGWLHNDFRNENMVGDLPVVIDWGASHGYGPFLHDLAPYLLGNNDDIQLFISTAFDNHIPDHTQINRWLVSVLIYRLAGEIVWRYFSSFRKIESFDNFFNEFENNYPVYGIIGKYLYLYQ